MTRQSKPNDLDACWETRGVQLGKLDPVLKTFDAKRAAQKLRHQGGYSHLTGQRIRLAHDFSTFFQIDKTMGQPKGIVAIDLRRFP